MPADVELHGRGEGEHQPVRPRGRDAAHAFHGGHRVERVGQQAEVARHREEEQRNGENEADDEQAALCVNFVLARFGFRVFRFAAKFERLESSLRDGLANLSLTHNRRNIFEARLLGRKIDLGFQNAFEFTQCGFEPPRVVIVREPLDDQVRFACGDAVSRALDARDHVGQAQFGGIEFHRGALGRKIDDRAVHAVEFLEIALDGRHAVGAGHACDGEGELFSVGHGEKVDK